MKKSEVSLWELQNAKRNSNMYIMGIPDGGEKEK